MPVAGAHGGRGAGMRPQREEQGVVPTAGSAGGYTFPLHLEWQSAPPEFGQPHFCLVGQLQNPEPLGLAALAVTALKPKFEKLVSEDAVRAWW